MFDNLTIGEAVTSGERAMRRMLAFLVGFIVAFGVAYMVGKAFGVSVDDEPVLVAFGAVVALVAWYASQSDNRRAEREGDRTLITTGFLADIGITGLAVIGAGLFIGFMSWGSGGFVFAGGSAWLAAWLVGRYIWKGA